MPTQSRSAHSFLKCFDHVGLLGLVAAVVKVPITQEVDDVPDLFGQLYPFGVGNDQIVITLSQIFEKTSVLGLFRFRIKVLNL